MKEQVVVIHWSIIVQETEQTWQILSTPTLKQVIFLWKYKDPAIFSGHILTEGMFIIQQSSTAEISVRRTAWVMSVSWAAFIFMQHKLTVLLNQVCFELYVTAQLC